MTRTTCLLLTFLLPVLTACDESDSCSLRLVVKPDLSGTVTASGIGVPSEPLPVEQASQGAAWQSRGQIVVVSGSFGDLEKEPLRLGDLVVSAARLGDKALLEVALPRGPEVAWPGLLAPPGEDERSALRTLFDPKGETKELGAVVKIVLDLPAEPTAHGLSMTFRGLEEAVDGRTATLVVPLALVRTSEPARPLVWHLTF